MSYGIHRFVIGPAVQAPRRHVRHAARGWPEIDAVAVVVRLPSHYRPTKAAPEAGTPKPTG